MIVLSILGCAMSITMVVRSPSEMIIHCPDTQLNSVSESEQKAELYHVNLHLDYSCAIEQTLPRHTQHSPPPAEC